jgi:hypothetical protein
MNQLACYWNSPLSNHLQASEFRPGCSYRCKSAAHIVSEINTVVSKGSKQRLPDMTEAQQQRAPVAAGAETAQTQLASAWLHASSPEVFLQQLAVQHKLTQQQVHVVLNVQRQCDAAGSWRIISMPASAGLLSGHMIVELKQQHVQTEQELVATHSITCCVYAPCGRALPAKDAHALITQHVMSAHSRLRRLEQQRKQLLAASGSVVVKAEPEQQLQQLKLIPEAYAVAAVAAGATAVAECGILTAAATTDPDTPPKPESPQTSGNSSVGCCKAEQLGPVQEHKQEQGPAVEQQGNQQLHVPKQEVQDEQQELQDEQQPSPMLIDPKPEATIKVSR